MATHVQQICPDMIQGKIKPNQIDMELDHESLRWVGTAFDGINTLSVDPNFIREHIRQTLQSLALNGFSEQSIIDLHNGIQPQPDEPKPTEIITARSHSVLTYFWKFEKHCWPRWAKLHKVKLDARIWTVVL